MNHLQSDGHKINHLLYTQTTDTTAISQCFTNPTSHVPASPTHHLPLNDTTDFTQPRPQSLCHQSTHNAVLTPGNQKPEPNRPTFDQWCQQHAATTPHIQRIISHRKVEIFHFLLSTSTRTMYAHEEYTTDRDTNRIRTDPLTQTHDIFNDPNTYSTSTAYLPVPNTTNMVPTTRLQLTSTLR